MQLTSLFGNPIEMTQPEFSEQVKQALKEVKKIELSDSLLRDPKEILPFIQSILQGYKSMLEQRYVTERTLKGILKNICKASLFQFSSCSDNAMKKSYSYLKEILEKKNTDYGNSALKNGGLVGNYVRIMDKVSRIESLQQSSVSNFESLQDTWLDLAGYAVIGLVILSVLTESES